MTQIRRQRRRKRKTNRPIKKKEIGCHGAVVLHNNYLKAQRKRGEV